MRKTLHHVIDFPVMVVLVACSVALMAQEGGTQAEKPCSREEARQFDFWIGEWELTWPGGQGGTPEGLQGRGVNVIRPILEGCVIEENFSTADGSFVGKSWSVYNPKKDSWQQTWVDKTGNYLLFSGEFKDGKMTLRTAPYQRDGKQFISRMVFENITENSLEWKWQRTEDNGETWTDLWDIHYIRKK